MWQKKSFSISAIANDALYIYITDVRVSTSIAVYYGKNKIPKKI